MKDDSHIISGFDHDSGSNNTPFVVDFATARLLNRSGSTCDAYECVIQRRRVFVKRLKAEYRDNPLYRAACHVMLASAMATWRWILLKVTLWQI